MRLQGHCADIPLVPYVHRRLFAVPQEKKTLDISLTIVDSCKRMKIFSTREAAKKIGITAAALSKYIAVKKVSAPKTVHRGATRVHAWTEREIGNIRKLLPKIANGRKTRYRKERAKKKGSTKASKKK